MRSNRVDTIAQRISSIVNKPVAQPVTISSQSVVDPNITYTIDSSFTPQPTISAPNVKTTLDPYWATASNATWYSTSSANSWPVNNVKISFDDQYGDNKKWLKMKTGIRVLEAAIECLNPTEFYNLIEQEEPKLATELATNYIATDLIKARDNTVAITYVGRMALLSMVRKASILKIA